MQDTLAAAKPGQGCICIVRPTINAQHTVAFSAVAVMTTFCLQVKHLHINLLCNHINRIKLSNTCIPLDVTSNREIPYRASFGLSLVHCSRVYS